MEIKCSFKLYNFVVVIFGIIQVKASKFTENDMTKRTESHFLYSLVVNV